MVPPKNSPLAPAAGSRSPLLMQPMLGIGEQAGPRIIDAQGSWVVFEDGVCAVDVSAQDSSVILGHRCEPLHDAVAAAAHRAFVSDTASGSPDRDAAVEALSHVALGADWAGGVRFTLTGSEAVDLALALARNLTRRDPLAARRNSYHGAVGLSRDVTLHPLINGGLADPRGGWLAGIPGGVDVRQLPLEDELDDEELGRSLEGVAAVITDFGSGHVYPSNEYFERIGRAAAAAGAYWIHDETVSAYGRTGTGSWMHFQELAIAPDMVVMAKCITGGAAPGAALAVSRRVVDDLGGRRWAAGSTYWGHHLQTAAVTTMVKLMVERNVVAHAQYIGALLGERLDALVAAWPTVFAAHHGRGLIRSLEIVGGDPQYRGDGMTPAKSSVFATLAREHGALVSAYGGAHLWLVPPLVIDETDLDAIISAFEATAADLA